MRELSDNINAKVKQLHDTHNRIAKELEQSKTEEISALNLRVEKLQREKANMENELQKYIKMYESLEKYFKDPHYDRPIFEEKSENSIYEVLAKTTQSHIHIF